MELRGRDLGPGLSGDDVALLHIELTAMGYVIAPDERARKAFGETTTAAVRLFQQHHGLPVTGWVDSVVTQVLGQAFSGTTSLMLTVRGRVTSDGGAPVVAGSVWAFDLAPDGVTLRPLGESRLDDDGRYKVAYPQALLHALAKRSVDLVVTVVTTFGQTIARTSPMWSVSGDTTIDVRVNGSNVDAPIVNAPAAMGVAAVPAKAMATVAPAAVTAGTMAAAGTLAVSGRGTVSGTIYNIRGMPVPGLTVTLHHVGFQCDGTLKGEATTDADGRYHFDYEHAGVANLTIRAKGTRDGEEVALSRPSYNAATNLVLNLVAPPDVAPLAAEYQRLLAAVTPHLAGRPLAAAKENDTCRDITLLARSTGWDGRLIALAAKAAQLASTTSVSDVAIYALLRVGLPSDAEQLARLTPETVDKAMRRAIEAGTVDLTEEQLRDALNTLQAYARTARLNATAMPGTLSTRAQMLAVSGLTPAEQDLFETVVAQHEGDPAGLWDRARGAGLPQQRIDALRLQGKLAYLTLNNAALCQKLQQESGTPENLEKTLVGKDLFRPEAWRAYLISAAGGQQNVASLIPPAFQGMSTDERLARYAEDLARKVRIGMPTRVVARRLQLGELTVAGAGAELVTVLNKAADSGFRLGTTPAAKFLNTHPEVWQGVADPTRAREQLFTLQRVYQTTPNDQAMQVLLAAGLTSAGKVTAHKESDFVAIYGPKLGTADVARQVYRKASQITGVVYNAFAAASQIRSTPPIHAISASAQQFQESKDNVVEHYPTLERLFGELDYCECEHCRSVLSPAAYLVDLLQFLDTDADVWAGTLDKWKQEHGNAPYPFHGPADRPDEWAQHPPKTPYQLLTARRPDLPHLHLSCENTNTAMPYIDVVNEILEYSVAENGLGAGAVRDVGGAQSEDLIAEPQNLIPQAYDQLRSAVYPIGLPYDTWLDQIRNLLRTVGRVDYPALLGALRSSGDPVTLRESLSIGAREYQVLTTDTDPLWSLYGYELPEQVAELSLAKVLARRLGVSYRELTDLLRTWFVNPDLDVLVVLRKLGLTVEDVLRYKNSALVAPLTPNEVTAFEERLAALTAEHGGLLDVKQWLDSTWNSGGFNDILVLADTNPGCDWEKTTVQHAAKTPITVLELRKLNVLVRLRRRLDWRLSEVDAALKVFGGVSVADLARLNQLTDRIRVGRNSRTALLTLWGPLDSARYAQLFLTQSFKARDPFFDHPWGRYLSYFNGTSWQPNGWNPLLPEDRATGNVGLINHLAVVQEALGLTVEEIKGILGVPVESAPLSLEVVSTLYRHRLLAKGLKLTIAELIALIGLSGVDPFAGTEATSTFVDSVELVRATGLSAAQLDFLLRHRFDAAGPLAPDATSPLMVLRGLAHEIIRIRTEHTVPTDPLEFTNEVFAQKAALVLPPDVAAKMVGIWSGTTTFEVARDTMTPLDPALYALEPSIAVHYDSTLHRQYLTYRGQLSDLDRLQATYGPDGLFDALLGDVRTQAQVFFERHLVEPVGFLLAADFPLLFAATPLGQSDQDWERSRRGHLAAKFLNYLQDFLIRRAVIAALAAATGADPMLVSALITDATLLPEPGAANTLLPAFADVAKRGLTLMFFASPDGSGPSLEPPRIIADPSLAGILPAGAASARITGYVEPPATGTYRFFISASAATTVATLRWDHQTEPLLRKQGAGEGAEELELTAGQLHRFTLELNNLAAPGADQVGLEVQAQDLPRGPLSRMACTPDAVVARFSRAHLLLSKALLFTNELELSVTELRHLSANAAEFAGFGLGKLPTVEQEQAEFEMFLRAAGYCRLRQQLRLTGDELLDIFRHARRELPITPQELVDDVCQRFATLTRRTPETVLAAAELLGTASTAPPVDNVLSAPGFVNELGLQRLWRVLELATRLGVAPSALGRWNNDAPDRMVAEDVRSTLRARYESDVWRRVAKPAFDALRKARRDALVAYLLHRDHLQRVEDLYERLLIDPGTEPVVLTSRLRLGISSVQLFIQRCLLNLEDWVNPSVIAATQWAWMKRYRVWEANRKIFLWPENWLEPEWRDQKTYQFQALEGALLQGDVNQDSAEDALYGYLIELDKIARLEIMSVWLEEAPLSLGPEHNVLHILGRRYNSTEYFYRKYSHRMWTPWEKVSTKIDGDHVVIAVWRHRPVVFWLNFVPQAETTDADQQISGGDVVFAGKPTIRMNVLIGWSEYVNGAWQTPDFDRLDRPKLSAVVPEDFDAQKVFVHARAVKDAETDAVAITLSLGGTRQYPATQFLSATVVNPWFSPQEQQSYLHFWDSIDLPEPKFKLEGLAENLDPGIYKTFYLAGRNSEPLLQNFGTPPLAPPFNWEGVDASQYTGSGHLGVYYTHKVEANGPTLKETKRRDNILGAGDSYVIVTPPKGVSTPGSPEVGSLIRPFFYQDNEHAFYVEPTLTERPVLDYDGWILAVPALVTVPDVLWHEHIAPSAPVTMTPEAISNVAIYPMQTPRQSLDSVVGPTTSVQFDEMFVGPAGGVKQ